MVRFGKDAHLYAAVDPDRYMDARAWAIFQEWWGHTNHFIGAAINAPEGTHYVDKDGTAWTQLGLICWWRKQMEALHGADTVASCLAERPGALREAFEEWVFCQLGTEFALITDELGAWPLADGAGFAPAYR